MKIRARGRRRSSPVRRPVQVVPALAAALLLGMVSSGTSGCIRAAHAAGRLVGRCSAPSVSAGISARLAKRAAWNGSRKQAIGGRTFYVSKTPIFTTTDIRTLRLEDKPGRREVDIVITGAAEKRLAAVTRANVGQWMVVDLDGSRVAPKIASAITSAKLVIIAPHVRLQKLCKSR